MYNIYILKITEIFLHQENIVEIEQSTTILLSIQYVFKESKPH